MNKETALYGQELYAQIADSQEYEMRHLKVGQLVNNGLDWGLIEGFTEDRHIITRVSLPKGFQFSLHERERGLSRCSFAYEAWNISNIVEVKDRDILKELRKCS